YRIDAYMERAQQHGLKVLLSLRNVPGKGRFEDSKDTEVFDYAADYIESMRDNPVLLAWYTNDEMGKEWLSGMQKMYDIFKRFDPDHPTFQVQDKNDQLEKDALITDILAP